MDYTGFEYKTDEELIHLAEASENPLLWEICKRLLNAREMLECTQ